MTRKGPRRIAEYLREVGWSEGAKNRRRGPGPDRARQRCNDGIVAGCRTIHAAPKKAGPNVSTFRRRVLIPDNRNRSHWVRSCISVDRSPGEFRSALFRHQRGDPTLKPHCKEITENRFIAFLSDALFETFHTLATWVRYRPQQETPLRQEFGRREALPRPTFPGGQTITVR